MAEPAVLGVPDTPESAEAHKAFATGTAATPAPEPVEAADTGEQTANPIDPGDKSTAPPDPK